MSHSPARRRQNESLIDTRAPHKPKKKYQRTIQFEIKTLEERYQHRRKVFSLNMLKYN